MSANQQDQSGRRERRQYDETFKRNAVELTLQRGRSVTQVAQQLGVAESMVYEWRRRYAPRPGTPASCKPRCNARWPGVGRRTACSITPIGAANTPATITSPPCAAPESSAA